MGNHQSFYSRTTRLILLAALVQLPQLAHATWLVMGTRLEVRASGCKDPKRITPERVAKLIQETERRYSTWTPDSELSRLNAGRDVAKASPELVAELETVLKVSSRWKGAFHPGLGRWVLASGVRTGSLRPIPESLGRPPEFVGRGVGAVLKDPRWVFEEGGFAKGLALDLAAEQAGAPGQDACELEANLGGQILHRGAKPIRVQIASPTDRSRPWVEITIQNASIATSGQSENPGHLIDPTTGQPVASQGSATAIHGSALEADIASTALAVIGSKAGLGLEASRVVPPGVDWIYLHPDGRAWAPARLKTRIQSLAPLKWQWVD
jgi:thiamine biosynthesis lipoprotein ApbE